MKFVSLFAGIGGFDLALERHGFHCVGQCEIDPHARAVLEAHFPGVPRHDDVQTLRADTFVYPDVVTFGSPCFPAGTLVLTATGYRPIEEIEAGDRVLTHRGRWRSVLKTGGQLSPTLRIKGIGHYGLETTPDHPFWLTSSSRRGGARVLGEPEWLPASSAAGKRWATPTSVEPLDVPEVDVSSGRFADTPKMDESFWYFVGRWLGDGWIRDGQRSGRPDGQTQGQVVVCAGRHKADALEAALVRVFGEVGRVSMPTTERFTVTRRPLAGWLVENFGHYAHGKRLPAWAFGIAADHRLALLDGMLDSDGHRVREGVHKLSTVSKGLAVGTRLLAEGLGFSAALHKTNRPSTYEIEGRVVNQRDTYEVVINRNPRRNGIHSDRHVWTNVKSVSEPGEAVPVFNLEVEEDNTYVVENIVVHNCQDLSVAGAKAGLDGNRSGLFREAVRYINELQEETDGEYPRYALWENVVGALSARAGADFRAVLEALVEERVPVPRSGKWANAGVVRGLRRSLVWRVLDAQYFGLAQRRARIFALLDLRGGRPEEVLLERQGLSGDPGSGRAAGSNPPARAPRGVALRGELVTSLTSSFGTGGPDAAHAQAGWLVPEVVPIQDGRGMVKGQNGRGFGEVGDPSYTLDTTGAQAVAFVAPFDRSQVTHPENRSRVEFGAVGGTLASSGDPCVVIHSGDGVRADPITVTEGKSWTNEGTTFRLRNVVQEGYTVRRLTPTECERLQGFPDGWTAIAYGQTILADTHRYRLIGNAVAVPVVEFIAERLAGVGS
jgi:site-specific DNA-cytosine methylase